MYTETRSLEQALNVVEIFLRKGMKVEVKPIANGYSVRTVV